MDPEAGTATIGFGQLNSRGSNVPRKLTVGSCFSGIGGLELGFERTGGFETKWQIEKDEYASSVLAKHWPGVKRYGDITTVDGGILEPVDLICGGFPCQDVSFAGKRAGLDGKRSTLWSELFRLVCEVKPRWFLGENVPGLLSSDDGRFFGNILRDLASTGFDVEWGVLSAAGVGAPHLRKRVFILAHSTQSEVRRRFNQAYTRKSEKPFRLGKCDWWTTEPKLARVAYGIPAQLDRRKCLGNAVVPQVAQKVGEMILEYEANG